MGLVPADAQLPLLYSQENVQDPVVVCKYFTPDSSWSWYALEYDGDDVMFGFVVGHAEELGYWSVSELEAVRGPLGLAIERDEWWKPTPLSKVQSGEVR